MRTTHTVKASEIERKWHVVDATGLTLGRLASNVASILRGKHKPIFTPHLDTGDNVIIINADKIAVTGKKLIQKTYVRHSGYIGGLKEKSLRQMLDTAPTQVIYLAVRGMLPKNVLGRQMIKKLRVFAGPTHNLQAQKPEVLNISTTKERRA